MADHLDLLITGARIELVDPEMAASEIDSIGIRDGRIVHLGPAEAAPPAHATRHLNGQLVTPGLVDCHTHLVWVGDRLGDFARRTGGESYADIATGGGGILSTVAATEAATDEDLIAGAAKRMSWLRRSGVTTVEVKSGYGMETSAELRLLEAARTAAAQVGVRVELTLLGAHALPADGDATRQVARVVDEMIPAVVERGLASAVDVFADEIAFSAADTETILEAAVVAGLGVKAHVGQIANVGAAQVVARLGGMSVDHCERLSLADVEALAESGTVAVLVPGASLYTADSTVPPVVALRGAGVPMAVTTDLNPGSSPLASLPTAGALSVHRFGLTPEEAVAGMTSVAARALGLNDGRGAIRLGGVADLAIWDAQASTELVYWLAAPICRGVVVGGAITLFPTEDP